MKEYRAEIDKLDKELVSVFSKRMDVAAGIAGYKKEHALPVYDGAREREKLLAVREMAPEALRDYTVSLYSLLFDLSRSYQSRLLGGETALTRQIEDAIAHTDKLFPDTAMVACQGVEGAYSQLACDKLFKLPSVFFFSTFGAVFSAIESGLCRYGVIPVENSTAGSVNAVYDLMMKHDFRIVRSIRLKVDHNLLVKPGTKMEDIKEIYSHAQALSQCGGFLQKFPKAKIIPCENTAIAAKRVAESETGGKAAISSSLCRKIYHLDCLAESIQDQGNNTTRFICISKKPEIYPGADRTSLMMVLPHEAGSLYKVLSRFYALGINLIKLESRPMPERNFEFMFYFDLDTSVYSPSFIQLMGELDELCESFTYLGSYSEVV
ncbi:MAG: bifunctional chorismate mutase/prephenate dehydratase [Oscillospiraceae bacterium]|nr:bifunctional chorismate mutase/prephenate dehydratase [Oscillospiraceae bacterium]